MLNILRFSGNGLDISIIGKHLYCLILFKLFGLYNITSDLVLEPLYVFFTNLFLFEVLMLSSVSNTMVALLFVNFASNSSLIVLLKLTLSYKLLFNDGID